jgi:hypothetical protein
MRDAHGVTIRIPPHHHNEQQHEYAPIRRQPPRQIPDQLHGFLQIEVNLVQIVHNLLHLLRLPSE